ncbi:MAG: hypothetical protein ABJP33_10355, partial [Pseudoruegeria sp.]
TCLCSDGARDLPVAPTAGGSPPTVPGLFFRFLRFLGIETQNHRRSALTQSGAAPHHANPSGPISREAGNTGPAGLIPRNGSPDCVGVDVANGPDETAFYCTEYPHCGCPGGTTHPDCPAIPALLNTAGRVH